jgi:dipeptidyl aminopeptidase/acylaminoacyl peptidase
MVEPTGRDESNGVPSQPRKDLSPPPYWRLEAVAATERPRSLTVAEDGTRAVFIQDRDTSDVWLLDLTEPRPLPQRLTTGREPVPYWEDVEPRLSPGGSQVAYAAADHVWLVAAAGGPPRRLLEASNPVWVDDATLIVSIERGDMTRLAVVSVADPWPRPLAATADRGDEWTPAVSPDRSEVAYVFAPRADLNRSEIRVAALAGGAVHAVTGTPRMQDRAPAWSPDGSTLAFVTERSGSWALHVVRRDGSGERQLTGDGADYADPAWHPGGGRIAVNRAVRNRFGLAVVDAGSGAVTELAAGGAYGAPRWTAAGDLIATYEDHATPPELRVVAAGESARTLLAPAPLAIKSAPHIAPQEVAFRSRDGLEVPGFLFRPQNATEPVPAVVYPHGGPTDAYRDEWDGHAQYFLDKGYAWLAVNFRGSTGYGRDFERANHGVWGVEDVWDCLAAADHLKRLDWVDGDRLAIFGSSYGSYMALLAVTDDPEHRFRCAVAKYGDCDILTSWAQGDRLGVQDLERMMGHPSSARAAYRAGSPFHRLRNVEAPILVAHGERDERVSPKQSEQLVAELRRLGKTFEYVTYPTEAHGLLRAGPQLDFYRRLERFLDWYLL